MSWRAVITILAVAVTLMAGTLEAFAQLKTPFLKAEPLYRKDTVTICVMGDIMMHSAQIENARKGDHKYDFGKYFKAIEAKVRRADIAIANMEFTHAGEPYTGYPRFSAPDCYSEYLADCGFDIFLAANNHIFDRGCEGAARTLDKYRELGESHGIRYCGLAMNEREKAETNPLIIKAKGISIAIINFTYGTNLGADMHWPKVCYMNDRTSIKSALDKASETDFTLVLPHWGNEYELTHSPQQRETASWLIRNGADMIIGSHPHVAQDCETIDGVQVAYSLGNAVSNMSATNTQAELMAEIRLVRETNGDIKILPIEFTWLWCSRPGGYSDSYSVIPIEENLGRKEEWKGPWEHDKMTQTYDRVRKATGINTL